VKPPNIVLFVIDEASLTLT